MSVIIVPEWNTKSHGVFFYELFQEQDGLIIKADSLFSYSIRAVFYFVILFLPYFLCVARRDLKNFKYQKINFGFSIAEEIIRNSKTAKLYHVSNYTLFVRCFWKAIRVYTNLKCLIEENDEVHAVGGDSAYITFSVIAQMIPNTHFVYQNGLVGFGVFQRETLSGAGVVNWRQSSFIDDDAKGVVKPFFQGREALKSYMDVDDRRSSLSITDQTVVIFTHDFFDSPGVFGASMFNDHVEWVEKVIQICRKHEKPFILKSHPNGRASSNIVLKNIAKKYDCEVITSEIEWEQIRDTRSIIFTVYGTVASEGYFSQVPVYAFGSGNYSRLPNVVNVFSYMHLEYIIRNIASLKVPNYEAKIFNDFNNCVQKISDVTIHFAFDLALDDCSEALWKEIGFSKSRMRKADDRYQFLRKMEPIDVEAFSEFCRNSVDFKIFKQALFKSMGLS